MVTCQRLLYWKMTILCKACKLSFQFPLLTLTDPGTGANLTSHITTEQAKPVYYLAVLKFSLPSLSAFLPLLGIFFFFQSKGNLEKFINSSSKTFNNFSVVKHTSNVLKTILIIITNLLSVLMKIKAKVLEFQTYLHLKILSLSN